MGKLRDMQAQHKVWMNHNFPEQTAQQSFLGMVEEQGEMAHALLKHAQGIRGMDASQMLEEVIDGHCDWMIFSFGLANLLGYDLEDELDRVFGKVMTRDWIANPEDAHEREHLG